MSRVRHIAAGMMQQRSVKLSFHVVSDAATVAAHLATDRPHDLTMCFSFAHSEGFLL